MNEWGVKLGSCWQTGEKKKKADQENGTGATLRLLFMGENPKLDQCISWVHVNVTEHQAEGVYQVWLRTKCCSPSLVSYWPRGARRLAGHICCTYCLGKENLPSCWYCAYWNMVGLIWDLLLQISEGADIWELSHKTFMVFTYEIMLDESIVRPDN